uniref:Hamartin n=1 Tax=Magallana gigas TaxID=29159 RepID=K1PLX0_MAGGI
MAANSVDGRNVQVDVRELFNLLESNQLKTVDEITEEIQQHLSAVKEAWLINSLVDYFYIAQTDRVIDILTSVREPHDKHLVEKLAEGIKNDKHQLLAMKLLLHVVCKQPMWVHKLIKPPIFPALIKCLKTDTDIPLLMTGVMVITILLPAIPSLVGKYLPDIFDIFGHLVSFNIRKPSNAPDIFLLHLQVALYGLFHRLYGMFPYTFLTYLRHHYSKKDNAAAYEESIKPMLERVRLHPHLISETREKEMDGKRWKSLEDHDVIVLCAKMSIDQIEGTWEEMSCPVVSSSYRSIMSVEGGRKTSTSDGKKSRSSISSPPQLSPPVISQDLISYWSPSLSVGLSTPPSSQRTTPATSVLENSLASLHQAIPGTSANTSTTATPRATPPITSEDDKNKGRLKTYREMHVKKLSLSNKSLPGSADGKSGSSSVPPSPLRAEFTTEPPRGIFKSLPVKQAARELQFDPGSRRRSLGTPDLSSENFHDSSLTGEGSLRDVEGEKSQVHVDLMESYSRDAIIKIQTAEEVDTEDQEVSDITKNPVPPQFQTAESVAKFMRSVNRIRFNSMSNEVESFLAQEKFCSKRNSRSCPNLDKMAVAEEEAEDQMSRSVSTTFKQSSVVNLPKVGGIKDSERTSTPNTEADTTKATNVTINLTSNVVNNIACQKVDAGSGERERDIISLLKSVLVPTKVAVCQRCSAQCLTNESPNKSELPIPVFETFSPPELLDRHLQMGGEIHAKQLSKIPLTNQDSINWTHFGGMPPADEVNILRGQIFMMKNQILYERNKRELHAKRNRRLLRKITTANALEEQTKAQAEQIQLMNTEIQNLTLSCLNELDELRSAKTEMNTLLIRQREDQDALKAKLQNKEAELFKEQRINQHLKEQVQMTQRLKEQVLQLHKELLLMGELQGKYETKLHVIRNSHHSKPEQENMIATLRAENKALKEKMKTNTLNLDGFGKKLQDMEEHLQNKAVEDKYNSVCSINQRLEAHVMSLYGQIDQMERPRQAKASKRLPLPESKDNGARERTVSFPRMPPNTKPLLTKMSSVPIGCGLAGSTPTTGKTEPEPSLSHQKEKGKVKSDVTRTVTSGRVVVDQSEDTASISSVESGVSVSRRGNNLYSDVEEHSQSSKDSGYIK